MGWAVEFLNIEVRQELEAQPKDILASFLRISRLIEAHGLRKVHEPYVKHLEGRLWEMRMKGRDGIVRAVYVTATERYRAGVYQEDPENATKRDRTGSEESKGDSMNRKAIPVEEAAKDWFKDPEFVAEYEALEEEFAIAEALIKARGEADMTQEEVAAAMGTTQAVIARLESGRNMPSTRTLQRFAKATGSKLRISFESGKPKSRAGH